MKNTQGFPIIKIIASRNNWVEGLAVEQLNKTAELSGMKLVVGLPDLHPGAQSPVGAVFVTDNIIYPALAGSDIGCGMSLYQTDLATDKVNIDKLVKKLKNLDNFWDGSILPYLAKYNLPEQEENKHLGTIGGGNHFAELQVVDTIFDQNRMDALNINNANCYLLVHSGSRVLGQNIYMEYSNANAIKGIDYHQEKVSHIAQTYLAKHDHAVRWARANRDIIAQRFCEKINTGYRKRIDICHNQITLESWQGKPYWFHRKGASSAKENAVIIPGSRGHYSYLVEPIGNHESTAYSLAHGAGRKWQRSAAKARLSHKYRVKDLETTQFKSRVICENKNLIYEEAPQAYKNIEVVIEDLLEMGLIQLLARLKPLITYKTRKK